MIQNPILPGFHPDPSIIRVDDLYYLVNSTFEWLPGIPIYRSADLAHWELVGHALEGDPGLKGVSSACGVWAPALSYCPENSLYYLSYSVIFGFDNNNFDAENFVITAPHPTGPWSEPTYISSSGFDPSMVHDQDGRSYVVSLQWDFRQGYTHPGTIILQEYDKTAQKMVGPVFPLSKGATTRGCAEGPHIYRRNGYYYLMIAEGGTGFGHCITISRATSVTGPYEPYAGNPLLTSYQENFQELGVGDSAKPWRFAPGEYLQKSGHGILVETKEGETYCVHLCSRPITAEHRSVLGRETAIQKCKWENDWPVLEDGGILAQKMVPSPTILSETKIPNFPPQEGDCLDDFSKGIPLYYYAPRCKIQDNWAKSTENGLVLRGQGTLFSKYKKSLLARKINSFSHRTDVKMACSPESFLQMAGLTHYYNNQNFYYLRVYHSDSLNATCLAIMEGNQGVKQEYLESRVVVPTGVPLYLRGEVTDSALQYSYSLDGESYQPIGQVLDFSILSDEYAGGFTGSFVGVTATDLAENAWCATFSHLNHQILDKERKAESCF